jgi:putative autotransporter adhesin-like protein
MKRKILFLSLALLLALGGCKFGDFNKTTGSGKMKIEKRDVPAFRSLDISGAYDVEIVVQKEQSLELEGDDNLLPLIKTEVSNSGVLTINNEKSFSTKNKLRVRISVPNLIGISTSGASDIVASNIKSDGFDINMSGASNLQLSGETYKLAVEISGAGDLDAKDLHANVVSVHSSGAAKADVYASEELRAEVSGAGNVNYYGDPKVVKEDTSGAGTISKQ